MTEVQAPSSPSLGLTCLPGLCAALLLLTKRLQLSRGIWGRVWRGRFSSRQSPEGLTPALQQSAGPTWEQPRPQGAAPACEKRQVRECREKERTRRTDRKKP